MLRASLKWWDTKTMGFCNSSRWSLSPNGAEGPSACGHTLFSAVLASGQPRSGTHYPCLLSAQAHSWKAKCILEVMPEHCMPQGSFYYGHLTAPVCMGKFFGMITQQRWRLWEVALESWLSTTSCRDYIRRLTIATHQPLAPYENSRLGNIYTAADLSQEERLLFLEWCFYMTYLYTHYIQCRVTRQVLSTWN